MTEHLVKELREMLVAPRSSVSRTPLTDRVAGSVAGSVKKGA